MRNRPFFIVAVFACCAGAAEEPTPSFEIADVHPSPAGSPWTESAMREPDLYARSSPIRGGRYEIHSVTLIDLIATAYAIDPTRIIGGPAWIDTARFDVIAKAPAEAGPASLPAMLRSLLSGRFHVTTHTETRPFPEVALITSQRLLLKTSAGGADSGCKPAGSSDDPEIDCRGVTIGQVAETLPQVAPDYFQNNKLVDQTHLDGDYDFTLRWTRRSKLARAGTDGMSLAAAIEKQLGLKLAVREVPEPVLVVDKADRMPTPNAIAIEQLLPPVPLTFELATIKPSAPGVSGRNVRLERGGRINLERFTLKELITWAWDIEDTDAIDNEELIAGIAQFAQSTRYDVTAVAPPTAPVDLDSFKLMLRALLVDRFGLATHVETRTVSVLALTASKPRLQRAAPRSRSGCRLAPPLAQPAIASAAAFNLQCRNTTMAQLAAKLQALGGPYVPHPAIDTTGLTGSFDFMIRWNPPRQVVDSTSSDPNGGISIIEALDRQLGLKLMAEKRPMPVTIVDHLNPAPTAN